MQPHRSHLKRWCHWLLGCGLHLKPTSSHVRHLLATAVVSPKTAPNFPLCQWFLSTDTSHHLERCEFRQSKIDVVVSNTFFQTRFIGVLAKANNILRCCADSIAPKAMWTEDLMTVHNSKFTRPLSYMILLWRNTYRSDDAEVSADSNIYTIGNDELEMMVQVDCLWNCKIWSRFWWDNWHVAKKMPSHDERWVWRWLWVPLQIMIFVHSGACCFISSDVAWQWTVKN